jgi:quinol monooxygenase YgiN
MYGTVARMRVKPRMVDRLEEMVRGEESRLANAGFVATHIYRMDSDPNEYYMAVSFDSKEAYVRNADSPEQDASYRRMLEFLEGEPEWHDGEIVYSTPQSA